MSIKVIIAPYKDPAEGLDWNEQTPIVIYKFKEKLLSYPNGEINIKFYETDHGIGASFPTILLEIIGIASTLFFGIPTLHKKIRESLVEWKKIKEESDKFVEWLGNIIPIRSYSIEKVFLDALSHLESKANILDLKLLEVKEFFGKTSSIKPSFEKNKFKKTIDFGLATSTILSSM
ncbi:hypothetical protein IIC38_12320 [candidate division KSB1 bacterium]|nr:hypothetical protein [candidate division KSB1 bacterium]